MMEDHVGHVVEDRAEVVISTYRPEYIWQRVGGIKGLLLTDRRLIVVDGEGKRTYFLTHINSTALADDAGRSVAWTYLPAGVAALSALGLARLPFLLPAALFAAPGMAAMAKGIEGFSVLKIYNDSCALGSKDPAVKFRIGVPASDDQLRIFAATLDDTIASLR